jgi:hypothetical protein
MNEELAKNKEILMNRIREDNFQMNYDLLVTDAINANTILDDLEPLDVVINYEGGTSPILN